MVCICVYVDVVTAAAVTKILYNIILIYLVNFYLLNRFACFFHVYNSIRVSLRFTYLPDCIAYVTEVAEYWMVGR
jgi:hypothetical protein